MQNYKIKKSGVKYKTRYAASSLRKKLIVLSLQYFTTTVKAVRADMVTHVCFASCWLDTQLRRNQEIV